MLQRLFIILFLTSGTALAQSPALRHFTVEDGLPSNTVYDVVQDESGLIWFTTDHGICRYDGREFKRFTTADGLPDNEIFRTYYDSKGRIWFVTQNGVPGFYFSGNFYSVPKSELEKERGILGRYIEDHEGTIWISWANLDHVCFRTDGSIYNPHLKYKDLIGDYQILNSVSDTSGHIWLVLSMKGSGEYELVSLESEKSYSIPTSRWRMSRGLKFDSQNRLVQQNGSRFRRFEIKEETMEFVLVDTFTHPTEVIISVNEDKSKEKLLVGSWDGAMELSASDLSVKSSDLPSVHVSEIKEDVEGNFWYTSLNEGVYFRARNAYIHYNTEDGLPSARINVVRKRNNGEIWIASQPNWITVIDSTGIENIQLPYREGARAMIKDIDFLDDKTVVVTGDQGIYELVNRKYIRSNPIQAIDYNPATNGKIYITTRKQSIVELDQSEYNQLFDMNLKEREMYSWNEKSIKTILRDKRTIVHGGYDRMQLLNIQDSSSTDFSIPNLNILDFTLNGADVWISTNGGGVNRIVSQTQKGGPDGYDIQVRSDTIYHYTTQNGLSSNSCQTIESRNDTIYVGSNQGLSILLPEGDDYRIMNFQAPEYLPSNQIYDVELDGDNLLVGTANGLSVFKLDRLNEEPEALPFRIRSVLVDGEQTPLVDGIEFESGQNDLTVNVHAQHYQNASGITYRYRLNEDQSWVQSKTGEINLSSLSAGEYVLEVQIVYNGEPLDQQLDWRFVILNPVYKRSWFIFLIIVAIVGLMALVFFFRLRTLRRREEEKRKILEANKKALRSQMNPHFIFNSLNSIQHFILSNDSRLANKYLSKFSKLIRNVLQFSDRDSIFLFEEVGLLTDYLDLEKFRLKDKFDYQIDVDPQLNMNRTRLPSLVIQPIVENAVWHGVAPNDRPGSISVRFYPDGKLLKCMVEDNGEGKKEVINEKTHHESVGLTKTEERMKLWTERAEYKIEFVDKKTQNEGSGLRVIISLPLLVDNQ